MGLKKSKKKRLRRVIIVICSSLLIIVIVIMVLPQKSFALPSFSFTRLKSILKNVIKKDSKPIKTGTSNIKELIDEQNNRSFFQRKNRSFRLFIKNFRRKYLKKTPFKRTSYPFNSELNKKKMEMMRNPQQRPFSQRTTYLSQLIQQDEQRRQNDFKKFSKFIWSYYHRNQGIEISSFFDYPIEVIESFTLLPHIHPVRCLLDDPIYLEPLKMVNFRKFVFDYSNLKSPELINLGNPWF